MGKNNPTDEIEEMQHIEAPLDRSQATVKDSHSTNATRSVRLEYQDVKNRLLTSKLYLELLDLIDKDQPEADPCKSFYSFHMKKDESRKFRSGDIVALDGDSKLAADDSSRVRSSTFLVICDESHKKLARCMTFHPQGHWCMAVGIAKVRVDGFVAVGDLIGSKGDGTGCGITVTTSNDMPVIGFALSSSVSPNRSGSFAPSASSASSSSMATVLISQDPSFVAEKGLRSSPDGISSEESAAASDISVLMTMLERYVTIVSTGNQASPLREAFHRMRQQFLADHSGPTHARLMRHTLHLPGAPGAAGPAADEAELLSLRFGLPTHARVGALGFQQRAVMVAEVGQSLDAATYLEALVTQNRGSGLVCAVHGRAGCGKSALASAVVSRLQQCNSMAVVWLDASNLTTICRGMMALAKTLLGLGRRGGVDRQPYQQIGALQVVSAWLREERNWLLVLDDVRNVAELEELHIPLGNGMVLLTTRLPLDALKARFEGCTGVELGPFRPEEALSCVRRATGATDRDAMALSERVQHFPITLAHATAHLVQRKMSVSQFISDLNRKLAQEAKAAAQQPAEVRGADYPTCFLALLEMRITELRSQQSDSALRLIVILSFLNSRGIRYKMLNAELLPRVQESISVLFHQKLIGEDQEGLIHVHQLVQDAVREILADWSDSVDSHGGCCMTSTCYPSPGASVKLAISSDSLALAGRLVVKEMNSRDRDAIELAAPHALKLVGHNGQDLELLRITAEFLSEIQKDLTKSLEMRHCMLRVLTAAGDGADPMAVCETFAGIAKIHELLGQHNDAICAHEEVVRVLKKCRREPLRMAKTLDSIGMIFYRTQRFKGALLRFEEGLSIKESLPEAEAAPEIVITLERIADAYCAQGYYEIALEKWHRVLQILKEMPGDSPQNHKEIARVLNTMGLIHADLQRYDDALRFYHDSLETLRDSPGDVGMYEARIHTSIAKCHQSLGRYDDAVINYDRALAFQRKVCIGREELCISQTLDEMAYAFSVRGDYSSAVSNLRESLAIKLKILEPNDLKLARGKMELAMQLKHLGVNSDTGNTNIIEALDLIASARATYEHALGSADALTAQAAAVHSELLAASRAAADLSMAISPQSLTINVTPRSERRPKSSPRTPVNFASPRTPASPIVQGKVSTPRSPSLNFVLRSVEQRLPSDPYGELPPMSPQQRQDVF